MSQTLPVAVFAMSSMLPLLAAFDSAVYGVAIAVPRLMEGDVGGGLLMLLLVTPLFAVLNFAFFVVIATGIDRVVLNLAPGRTEVHFSIRNNRRGFLTLWSSSRMLTAPVYVPCAPLRPS